ncbi:hypothetical protein JS531_09600 [Bifidobacterium sp. CP2]|uniref:hypothetical protein n=1 Tax=Bifidobacterium sp. CP2 TaxID=2809025 RepID=UPI001BDD9E5D|nr:hypothetical protein [Bifidobacterium sp. CP2]MBT1182195.1 hypothetical protein [Bifidobacterium sp. CP2]
MKALLYRDWLLWRRSRLCVAAVVVACLFIPVVLAVLAGSDPRGADSFEALPVLESLGPWYGYVAALLSAYTLFSNATTMDMGATLLADGTLENYRGSGRSMLGYCLGKSLLPMLLAEFMTGSLFVYLLWAGLVHADSGAVLSVVFGTIGAIAGPAVLAFATVQMLLATHATTAGSFSMVTFVAAIPMTVFIVLGLRLSSLWQLITLIVFGMIALLHTAASVRRRYPNTLRSIL